jgi:hypothetical protein
LLSINPAICWELRVSRTTHRDVRPGVYDSDNVAGADNQQERLDGYISGYVDGEGSFSVSIQRNPTCRVGFQLVPEFHVSQNGDRVQVLEVIRTRLGCGRIRPNSRRDRAVVLVVRDRKALLERVIPFFERSPFALCETGGLPDVRPHRESDGSRSTSDRFWLRRAPRARALDERGRPVSQGRVERARSPTRILRDCMPDRVERPGRYSPSCMATCRVRQK